MLRIQNILLARDFLAGSESAVALALELAERTGARLHVVFADVLHSDPLMPTAGPAPAVERLRERVKELFEADLPPAFNPRTLWIEHVVVRGVAAAPAILDYAAEHDVDLIVTGTHGRRGVRRLVLGSVAEEIVRLAPCPVLTVRQRAEASGAKRLRTILVPVDFSEPAREALRHAHALGEQLGAHLDVLHVSEAYHHPIAYGPAAGPAYGAEAPSPDALLETLRTFHHGTVATGADGPAAEEALPSATFAVRFGHAAGEILRYAEDEHSDLIVMGTHGRTGLEHVLLGSVAERVVRGAPCPVFTLKRSGKTLLSTAAAAGAV